VALREALGAGRARLVRQLMIESVLIALLGGLLALAPAITLARVLLACCRTGRHRSHRRSASTDASCCSRCLRAGLVVLQIAFTLVLLAGTGVLLRTLLNLRDVEPIAARC
jgi:ABC-type antimicrobial peptide transport system permease subunit